MNYSVQAFGLIRVEERLPCTTKHGRELPPEVVNVLDPAVHTNAAGGTAQMGGVARQENPLHAQARRHPTVDLEGARPEELEGRIAGQHPDTRGDAQLRSRRIISLF